MEYAIVPFSDIAELVAKNSATHAAEARKTEFNRPLQVDWKEYLEASEMGGCVAVVAKQGHDVAAYSVFTFHKDYHSKIFYDAMSDAVYVFPQYRNVKFTVEFIKRCDELVRSYGAKCVQYAIKSPAIGRILKMAGYKPTQVIWSSYE